MNPQKAWSSACIFFLAAAAVASGQTAAESAKHKDWDRKLVATAVGGGEWGWKASLGSSELAEALLATLAAGDPGAPGTIGAEMAKQAWRAARADGVLIRPDSPLTPTRASAVAVVSGTKEPMVAWAHSDHEGQRTAYLFAYDRSGRGSQATFTAEELGFNGQVMVLNRETGRAWRLPAEEPYLVDLGGDAYTYLEVAPVRPNGMVFFGDQGKFVSDGKARIAEIENVTGGLVVSVNFAGGESVVGVFGFARSEPVARARVGSVGKVNFNSGNGRFTVLIHPQEGPGRAGKAKVEIVIPAPVFTRPTGE